MCSVRGERLFNKPIIVKVTDVDTTHWNDTFLDPYVDFVFVDIPEGEEAKELFGGHDDGAYYGWTFGRTYAIVEDMERLALALTEDAPKTACAFQETQRMRPP